MASDAESGLIGSHRFLTFVPIDQQIDTSWGAWFFRSELGLELIGRASPGSAGRNRTLGIDRFEALEIPLPSIDEQRRTVEMLNRVAYAARCVESLGSRAINLAGRARSSLTAGTAQSKGGSARTRRRVALGEVLRLNCHEMKVDARRTYRMAGVYSFGRGMFTRADLDGSQTSYRVLHELRAGQLVMSRLKAWEGALALVPARLDGWFLSPEFPIFDIDAEQVDPGFLAALVTSEIFLDSPKGCIDGYWCAQGTGPSIAST